MRRLWTAGVVLSLMGALTGVAHADEVTSRISVAADGAQGNRESRNPSLSADGRYVAFDSDATNLVPGDTNDHTDVFVRDRQTGTTTRVSVAGDGSEGADGGRWPNPYSSAPVISSDGRFVAFRSWAPNLVPGDTNSASDVFLRDTLLGVTTRISVTSNGAQADELSYQPSMSTDGRYIAFGSGAANLVPGDDNGVADVFRHDRVTGTTIRISPAAATYEGWIPDGSKGPAISGDGRFVAYWSDAVDIVQGDTNKTVDVFVHDVDSGATGLVSSTVTGTPASTPASFWTSINVAMSADARYIGYNSGATNLVDGDTNAIGDVFVSRNSVSGHP